ncbi:hypothetical protein CSB45_00525 [candidate division KSB3 bacterium]|uniref:Uncharacterized protein n=1 Tax=candidate division KSB3 bacterium TaxID=2044937 RepID=A0A2G6EE56_9BACT|nr:MAG: hypothetical protein CSB45_00525 [candidate division KSB3 bacterium]
MDTTYIPIKKICTLSVKTPLSLSRFKTHHAGPFFRRKKKEPEPLQSLLQHDYQYVKSIIFPDHTV